MKTWTDDDTLRVFRLGSTCHIRLAGELDAYAVEQFPPAELLAAGGDFDAVVLDLADLDYIDSTGLRWVLRLHRAAQAKERPMTISVWEDSVVYRTIQLIGAGDVFPVEFVRHAPDPPGRERGGSGSGRQAH